MGDVFGAEILDLGDALPHIYRVDDVLWMVIGLLFDFPAVIGNAAGVDGEIGVPCVVSGLVPHALGEDDHIHPRIQEPFGGVCCNARNETAGTDGSVFLCPCRILYEWSLSGNLPKDSIGSIIKIADKSCGDIE